MSNEHTLQMLKSALSTLEEAKTEILVSGGSGLAFWQVERAVALLEGRRAHELDCVEREIEGHLHNIKRLAWRRLARKKARSKNHPPAPIVQQAACNGLPLPEFRDPFEGYDTQCTVNTALNKR